MEHKMGLDLGFGPIDMEQMRPVRKLSAGQRIQRLLHARTLAVGVIRGRLRRRYPDLSDRELNLKLIEELDCVQPSNQPVIALAPIHGGENRPGTGL